MIGWILVGIVVWLMFGWFGVLVARARWLATFGTLDGIGAPIQVITTLAGPGGLGGAAIYYFAARRP